MQQIGKGVAAQTPNRTFHYPYPSASYPAADQELQDVLKALAGEEVKLTMRGGERLSYRFELGDSLVTCSPRTATSEVYRIGEPEAADAAGM